ncbi:DUF6311 domain-containing protein [Archangium primigenium]|uniref:DUF6311 domain-containing protein n=1 Tax=[Archangium] primigenium TaxID=2792470 RepID=UPI00195A754A|nr:hypothetical protein [Archangium primigenium]
MPHDRISSRTSGALPWAGALIGALWFIAVGGGRTLDPTYLDWLGASDLAQHTLGWLHFRDAPWGLPLGRTPSLMRPLLTTVGFSDANPWVSLLLKPFSRWLPRDFQFIGPWLLLCFALQGWMGVKLVGLFTPRALPRLLGSALFVMSPVLLFRFEHDTLCAHWLLLAMLYLNLRPREDARAAWRALGQAAGVNALASGIHPYLEVMVFGLTLALALDVARTRRLSWRAVGAGLAGVGVLVGGLFLLFGYVGQGVSSGAGGFGFFSADLLTLVNPRGWTRVLPSLPSGDGQYEGFGYLGTGVLALGVGALVGRRVSWGPPLRAAVRAHAPLVGVALLCALLAFSSVMTVAGQEVLTLRSLVKPLLPLLGAFRSSGRFIWVLHYTLMTGILALVLWRTRTRPRVATAVLGVAVLLQALDTPDLWRRIRFLEDPWRRLRAPEWAQVDSFYRHIVLYPPSIHGSGVPCVRNTFPDDEYLRFGDLAYRRGLSTNSGYSARLDERHVAEVCAALEATLEGGRLSEDTLYVVDASRHGWMRRMGERLTCGVLEGFTVCVAARTGRFREALSRTTSGEFREIIRK